MVSPLCGYSTYTLQSVNIAAYANGSTHTLEFYSASFWLGGTTTNFFVDDVALVCN